MTPDTKAGALRPVGEGSSLYQSVLRRAGVLVARNGLEHALLEEGHGRPVLVAAAAGFGTAAALRTQGWAVSEVASTAAWREVPAASVDAVVLVHVLADADALHLLSEARRVLRPRGRVVVIDENPRSLMHHVSPRLRRRPTGARGPLPVSDLREALLFAGFTRVSVRTTSVGLGAAWLSSRAARGGGPWAWTVRALDPLWVGSTKLHPEWGTQVLGWAMP